MVCNKCVKLVHRPVCCSAMENKWRVRFFKIAVLLLIENCNKAGVGVHTHTHVYAQIVA